MRVGAGKFWFSANTCRRADGRPRMRLVEVRPDASHRRRSGQSAVGCGSDWRRRLTTCLLVFVFEHPRGPSPILHRQVKPRPMIGRVTHHAHLLNRGLLFLFSRKTHGLLFRKMCALVLT
jgi:hypothetical protein